MRPRRADTARDTNMTIPEDPAFGCGSIPTERQAPAFGCGSIPTERQAPAFGCGSKPAPDEGPGVSQDKANKVVAQYRQIAKAVMTDAETWLRQRALSRAIPEAMPDAIMVTDEAGIIISVNSQFELMFGYHRSEVIGNTPEMLLPEASRARHIEQRRSFVDNPRVRGLGENLGLLGRRKNGLEFRVLVKLGPVVIPAGVYTIAVIRRVRE
jgi:PAS domain S-box-containing protein